MVAGVGGFIGEEEGCEERAREKEAFVLRRSGANIYGPCAERGDEMGCKACFFCHCCVYDCSVEESRLST